jgi:hypothetical protein
MNRSRRSEGKRREWARVLPARAPFWDPRAQGRANFGKRAGAGAQLGAFIEGRAHDGEPRESSGRRRGRSLGARGGD